MSALDRVVFTLAGEVYSPLVVESCDSAGTMKGVFMLGEAMHIVGVGYASSTAYDLYVVSDMDWTDGVEIPSRVEGTAETVTSDAEGNIPPSLVWVSDQPGHYDVVVDVNGDHYFDSDSDALNDNDIQVISLTTPEAWSTDPLGNAKTTFQPSDEVYVRGTGFPADTEVDIYIIPDDQSPSPSNAAATAAQTTDNAGELAATLVWSPPLDLGLYDIWVDVNQNGVFDGGDALNNQVLGVYSFNVVPEPAILVSTLLMVGALAAYGLARKRRLCMYGAR